MKDGLEIYLRADFQAGTEHHVCFQIGQEQFREYLRPLGRNREVPFEYREQAEAIELREKRKWVTRCIADELAEKLMQLIEKQDTHYGYSPQEWEAMYRQ